MLLQMVAGMVADMGPALFTYFAGINFLWKCIYKLLN